MKPFARINLSSAALRRGSGNGMCNYPVSNIQYPLFNDGGANWILAVGYLHISTFYKKGATHETICTNLRELLPMWKCCQYQFQLPMKGKRR